MKLRVEKDIKANYVVQHPNEFPVEEILVAVSDLEPVWN